MPRTKKAERREVGGRERLLREAVRLFSTKGYAATTVRDLLRGAGVTAPALYYHFGSKEGVFLELVREGAQKLDRAVEETLRQPGSAADRIRGFCRAVAAVQSDHVELVWIVDAVLSGPTEAAPRVDFRALIDARVRLLEGLVRGGIRSGEFRKCNPLHAALALLGAVAITSRSHLILDAQDQLDGMVSVILDGLKVPNVSRTGRRKPAAART